MFDSLNFQERLSIDSEPLRFGQVHLWWISLEITEQQEQEFRAVLSDQQEQKMNRLQNAQRRRHYIAGRGYLYQLLSHYCSPDQVIALQFNKHGKPSLINNEGNVRFNFTDTCGYGLFAFSLGDEIGVDVENCQRKGNFERIVQRRFSPEEQYLSHASMEQFLCCWTRKEAYGKATGTGLNYPLREHVMCADLSQPEFMLEDQQWYGQQFAIHCVNQKQDKFIACLVSQSNKAKELVPFHLNEA